MNFTPIFILGFRAAKSFTLFSFCIRVVQIIRLNIGHIVHNGKILKMVHRFRFTRVAFIRALLISRVIFGILFIFEVFVLHYSCSGKVLF